MFSKVISCGIIGIDGYLIDVETDIDFREGTFDVVGLGDTAVKESRERVRSAIKNTGSASGYLMVIEALNAVKNGADEIDMVIHVGALKDRRLQDIEEEIREVKEACGDRILKVIIETCLLTEEEKIIMCDIVTRAGADFIKTSTGFSKGGATAEDVALLRKHVGKNVKVKAAGGISSLEDAEKFISLGADRLGSSRIVKLLKERK